MVCEGALVMYVSKHYIGIQCPLGESLELPNNSIKGKTTGGHLHGH
jgi:hypothetical protein